MNTKRNLTVAALVTLLSVPAFSTGHMAHLSIPKFSDSLMVKAHADSQYHPGVPTSLVGQWTSNIHPDHEHGYYYSGNQLIISNDSNGSYISYYPNWYNKNKQFQTQGLGLGAGTNPYYRNYGNGKYVIDTSASNGFVSTVQKIDPYDMNVWNEADNDNQYLGTFHKDGAPVYHPTTPTANTGRKKSSKPNIPQNDSNYDKPGSHNIPGETWHRHSKTTTHTSYVSLPSSYLGKWYASHDYGPKSAGNGKSVYSPYSVDLGRNQGHYYASNYDNGPIVYTYGTEGGFTGYHYWLKNEQAAGGGNNFRLLPNGELEWHEDTSTWHLHRVHHHTPKSDSTPSSKSTPTPDSTPSSDLGANSNSSSNSTPSTNNDNDTDNDNDSGTVTPTASTTGTNGTDSNYQNNQDTNSASTTSAFNNTNLGSVNNTDTDNISSASSNTDTNTDNELPQTNESNHTTAEAILGATALTASASLMALDFSKKHKYEIMENTDAKYLSNSNSRSYNKIMGDTFADLSKSLKNM